MKTFEIWSQQSNGYSETQALHIIEADSFLLKEGVYIFQDSNGINLHAIVAASGLLIRTAGTR